jgi:CO/xanthine dehydrogenase Mo-binding subunit
VIIRTGKVDFGQSTAHTAYKQLVAEEMYLPYEAITTVVMGDTDRTPDGGFSAGFLEYGGQNLRKAAAYTYQAILDLAATTLKVEKSQLSVKDGVISGGGTRMTYGELVRGQDLKLTIPVQGDLTNLFGLTVTGNPPLKPTSQYTIVGKSFANAVTPGKVMGKEAWVTNVRLPDMLHGRVVHPKTLGSTLIAAGTLDPAQFPTSKVIVKGNLVGVVAATEWEAIKAAQSLTTSTKWTDWKGLPGHTQVHQWLREKADWKSTPVAKGEKNTGATAPALAAAARTLKTSYDLPFMKHAPIGPTIAVGDVRPDGTVFRPHAQPEPAGAARPDRDDAGHAGGQGGRPHLRRSRALRPLERRQRRRRGRGGDPVAGGRQTRARAVDARRGSAVVHAVAGILFGHPHRARRQRHHHGLRGGSLHAGDAGRPAGGRRDRRAAHAAAPPVSDAPFGATFNAMQDPWLYGKVPNVTELGRGTVQLGQEASPLKLGLRDHSMRTPGQLQQNFPRELAISEAAALAGIDPIEFRLKHTSDERLIGVLKSVRDASGWQTRTSPDARAASTGPTPVRGQGVSVMLRSGTYWACVCHVTVVPATGKVDRGQVHDRRGPGHRGESAAVEAADSRAAR